MALFLMAMTLGLGTFCVKQSIAQETKSHSQPSKKKHTKKSNMKASKDLDSVWVEKSDGALQCEQNSGIALEVGRVELEKTGVKVMEAKKGHDGDMHAQVCGVSGGSLNTYKILKQDLPKAMTLGFKEGQSQ